MNVGNSVLIFSFVILSIFLFPFEVGAQMLEFRGVLVLPPPRHLVFLNAYIIPFIALYVFKIISLLPRKAAQKAIVPVLLSGVLSFFIVFVWEMLDMYWPPISFFTDPIIFLPILFLISDIIVLPRYIKPNARYLYLVIFTVANVSFWLMLTLYSISNHPMIVVPMNTLNQ